MQNPNITIGGQDVISAGTVVYQESDVLRIKPTGSGAYFIEFRFVDDITNRNSRTVKSYNEGDGKVVECTNFSSNSAYTTLSSPLYVGNLGGTKMMMLFSIFLVGKSPKTWQVSYTVYKGSAVNG